MSRVTNLLAKARNAVGALFILAIVLVVPVFSIFEIGHFFQVEAGTDGRNADPLPALTVRPIDAAGQNPRLFEEPLITISFDDGHETTYSTVMPLLQKYGIRTTQYVLSGTANDSHYVSWDQITQMQKAGHEIACHSRSHADLTSLDDEDLDRELRHCKEELSKRYGTVHNFASPYGAKNERTLSRIAKYFSSQRNTAAMPIDGIKTYHVNLADNFNRNQIYSVTVRGDTTLKQLEELVAYTQANNGWLVLTYHQADDHSSQYSVSKETFEKHFTYLSGTDVRIVTVSDALQALSMKGVEY